MNVHYGRKCQPSAAALSSALAWGGYNGPEINFGLGVSEKALNKPEAIKKAVNKREMREIFDEASVPMPKYIGRNLSETGYEWHYPIVGRPDNHRKGRGFWLIKNIEDYKKAIRGTRKKKAATHFMDYIEAEREFRVHIVAGKSIKISEKIGDGTVKNHGRGAIFQYPHEFNHKITLRKAAVKAVEALGLDFGAVDVLWADGKPYVLEVNTAPCLTDENSDTLDRYVKAFVEFYNPPYEDDEFNEEDGYEPDFN